MRLCTVTYLVVEWHVRSAVLFPGIICDTHQIHQIHQVQCDVLQDDNVYRSWWQLSAVRVLYLFGLIYTQTSQPFSVLSIRFQVRADRRCCSWKKDTSPRQLISKAHQIHNTTFFRLRKAILKYELQVLAPILEAYARFLSNTTSTRVLGHPEILLITPNSIILGLLLRVTKTFYR